jgi:hypothetical protein
MSEKKERTGVILFFIKKKTLKKLILKIEYLNGICYEKFVNFLIRKICKLRAFKQLQLF